MCSSESYFAVGHQIKARVARAEHSIDISSSVLLFTDALPVLKTTKDKELNEPRHKNR